jgi:hypothetical protein
MALIDKIKKFENLHIVFWLIKDTCWMLEIKWLGTLMVLQTIGVPFISLNKASARAMHL